MPSGRVRVFSLLSVDSNIYIFNSPHIFLWTKKSNRRLRGCDLQAPTNRQMYSSTTIDTEKLITTRTPTVLGRLLPGG